MIRGDGQPLPSETLDCLEAKKFKVSVRDEGVGRGVPQI
jgi:hypothetical protein